MAIIKGSKHGILFVIGIVMILMIASLALASPARAAARSGRRAAESIQQLPGSTSQLPLISFLGFGMLTGGLISAMRTRPEKQAEKF